MKATIKDRIVAHQSAPDVYDPPSFEQMADHIEELDAKLAKAVETLKKLDVGEGWAAQIARTTLAELTGGKDEWE